MKASLLFASIAALFYATPALADHTPESFACAERSTLMKAISEQYKETSRYMGVDYTGKITEILVSDDGATWTILVTNPVRKNGRLLMESCILTEGEAFQATPEVMLDKTGL